MSCLSRVIVLTLTISISWYGYHLYGKTVDHICAPVKNQANVSGVLEFSILSDQVTIFVVLRTRNNPPMNLSTYISMICRASSRFTMQFRIYG